MADGAMVIDMRVGEELQIDVPPQVALDSRRITLTLKHKGGQRVRLVVQADRQFKIGPCRRVATPE